jgi:hypothetical protein
MRAAPLPWRVTIFPLALVVALLATDVPVVHAHRGPDLGLYNEECPLGRLATLRSAALPDASPAPRTLGPAPDLPSTSPAPAPAVRPLDSPDARAPPLPDPFPA